MSWAKVNSKTKKPIAWWYHKLVCEFGWIIRNIDSFSCYYKHLNKCCDNGFNLYGDKI